jgi:hypothetical protein
MMEDMVDSYNEKKANENTMKNISLKGLIEAEDFKAKSKETGKLVHFKSKDSYDAAIKAGSHEDPKAGKGKTAKAAAKPNDMFGGDYAKDRGGETPTVEPDANPQYKVQDLVKNLSGKQYKEFAFDNDIDHRDPMEMQDFISSLSDEEAATILKKYGQSGTVSKADTSKAPAIKHTKVGPDSAEVQTIAKYAGVREKFLADFINQHKLDAAAVANFVEKGSNEDRKDFFTAAVGNPGNKYQKKIIDKFGETGDSKDEPTSKPKEARKGNPSVNKEAKKNAESFGITPQKLGNDGYKKVMLQAAVEALTDANFHDEARELISKIEGKPEWAKKVDYPKMDDPKYKEKMADIRTNGVDSSEYWRGDDNAHEFGRKVSSASGWDGVDAADGIAFTLRMNGFHKQADMIQSVFDNKPYMRESSIKLTKMMKK